MIRSKGIMVALIFASHMHGADTFRKDAARVASGTLSGAAVQIGGSVMLEFLKEGTEFGCKYRYADGSCQKVFSWRNVIDVRFTPVWATLGALVGLSSTTYAREYFAQWLISCHPKSLHALLKKEYENDAALIAAVERYYLSNRYPLVAAKNGLAQTLQSLAYISNLIQDLLNELDVESDRAKALNALLDETYMMYVRVEKAAVAIESDPRLTDMLAALDRADLVEAERQSANARMLYAVSCILR